MKKVVKVIFTILIITLLILLVVICGLVIRNLIMVNENSEYNVDLDIYEESSLNEENADPEEVDSSDLVWLEIYDGTGREIIIYENFSDTSGNYYLGFADEFNENDINVIYSFCWESDIGEILASYSANYNIVKNEERYYIIDLESRLIAKIELPENTQKAEIIIDSKNEPLGIMLYDDSEYRGDIAYYSIESNKVTIEYGEYDDIDNDMELLENTGYISTRNKLYKDNYIYSQDIYLLDSYTGEVLIEDENVSSELIYYYSYKASELAEYIITSYSASNQIEYLSIYYTDLKVLYSDYLENKTVECEKITNIEFDEYGNLKFDAEGETYIYEKNGITIEE